MFFRVLSIDAWGNKDEGYEWNDWYTVATVDLNSDCADPATDEMIIDALCDRGLINAEFRGDVEVEDDQYNAVIVNKHTREPIYAIDGFNAC